MKTISLSATHVPKKCHFVDAMKDATYIPSKDIKPSSTKRGKKPTDVRPGGDVWTSKKLDRKPKIEIIVGDGKPVPTKSVKVIKAKNVKKVKVVFVLANSKKVTKVSIHVLNVGFSLPLFLVSKASY